MKGHNITVVSVFVFCFRHVFVLSFYSLCFTFGFFTVKLVIVSFNSNWIRVVDSTCEVSHHGIHASRINGDNYS